MNISHFEPIKPSIRKQLASAYYKYGPTTASYHLDRFRAEIDKAKCKHDDRNLRHSLIRKITAQRYRELRRVWNFLTNSLCPACKEPKGTDPSFCSQCQDVLSPQETAFDGR